MEVRVLDASLAVRLLVEAEVLPLETAESVLQFRLVAPSLIEAEVANSIWKMARARMIVPAQSDKALEGLRDMTELWPVNLQRGQRAMALSIELDHPTYDCFYLALAEELETHVLTLDKRLAGKLQGTKYEGLAKLPEGA